MTINKKIIEVYIVPFFFFIISITISLFSKNVLLSFCILIFGLLNGWFAGTQKWYNYIFASIFTILNAYVSFKAGLYGTTTLSMFLYFPLQIQGLFNWYNKKNNESIVPIRSFNTKTSILITLSCFSGSIALGFILSIIPNQQLAFLDATSNAINLCAIILMNLRFKECWWILLGNNIADLSIWIINSINKVSNSITMLIVSVIMLLLNIIAIIKWESKKS